MKKLMQSLKRQEGFTLVELMVVVAIIGLLSAVAVPNFKKYQARSKVTEAKLQLSALYTAEQSFFSDYNIYGHCLRYMGFDPAPESLNRYYSIGFPAGLGTRDAGANTAALNSGLRDSTTECPAANTAYAASTANNATWYAAGKGIGSSLISAVSQAAANAAGTAAAACNLTGLDLANGEFGSCTGTQATNADMVFQAAAVGIISAEAVTDATASGLNINHNKQIKNAVNGY